MLPERAVIDALRTHALATSRTLGGAAKKLGIDPATLYRWRRQIHRRPPPARRADQIEWDLWVLDHRRAEELELARAEHRILTALVAKLK